MATEQSNVKATIDVDIGGTFTDCYVTYGGRAGWAKSPTTSDDLSRGFFGAVEEAARVVGIPSRELLEEAGVVRYSTTIALNALLQRKGPPLGLITTRGHEHMLQIGNGHQWGDGLPVREQRRVAAARLPEPLVHSSLIVGVTERIDREGDVLRPIDDAEVLDAIQQLVDAGVRGIVVSLLWSSANSSHEERIREIFEAEYPDVYLGNIPVLLSSEVVPKWREYARTNTTILSAYLLTEMSQQLLRLSDRLRESGYDRPIQLVQNTGGVAKVTRTRVVDTYAAGPVGGLLGSAERVRELEIDDVICTDMGGTSFDLGLVVRGAPRYYSLRPVIDRWAVDLRLLEVRSIGAGGGSIASLNRAFGDRLEVGPQSAGSLPGPACYGLGGERPTVTDADVVLGYLDPENFLGGRLQLEPELAEEAIAEHIADPLGISVLDAALAIKNIVDSNMAAEILKEISLKGFDPRTFSVFGYGGAGPAHACGYAEQLGIDRVLLFPESPVFCAFGSSTAEVGHVYERARPLVLFDPAQGGFLSDYDAFNDVVAQLEADLMRDMRSEGIALDRIRQELELELRFGVAPVTQRVHCPKLRIDSPADVEGIYEAFRAEVHRLSLGVAMPEAMVRIESFALHGGLPSDNVPPRHREAEGEGIEPVRPNGERTVTWGHGVGTVSTPIFSVSDLTPGAIVEGPAIGSSEDSTYVIPPQWSISRLAGGPLELRFQRSEVAS